MKKEAGFTLIEIIAVLIIGGIMMTVAGMAIVTGREGLISSRGIMPPSPRMPSLP